MTGLASIQMATPTAWLLRRVQKGTTTSGELAQRDQALSGFECRANTARRMAVTGATPFLMSSELSIVAPEPIHVDLGVTGTNRDQPGYRPSRRQMVPAIRRPRVPEGAGMFAEQGPDPPVSVNQPSVSATCPSRRFGVVRLRLLERLAHHAGQSRAHRRRARRRTEWRPTTFGSAGVPAFQGAAARDYWQQLSDTPSCAVL